MEKPTRASRPYALASLQTVRTSAACACPRSSTVRTFIHAANAQESHLWGLSCCAARAFHEPPCLHCNASLSILHPAGLHHGQHPASNIIPQPLSHVPRLYHAQPAFITGSILVRMNSPSLCPTSRLYHTQLAFIHARQALAAGAQLPTWMPLLYHTRARPLSHAHHIPPSSAFASSPYH